MLASNSLHDRVESLNPLDHYSIELTAKDVSSSLRDTGGSIPRRTPISVTYLPAEDMAMRVAAAITVRSLGFEPVPHISGRRVRSKAELSVFLTRLRQEALVEKVFVVAGDPPEPLGPFDDALAVIESEEFARSGMRQVGIAGYPEGHPAISEDKLWEALQAKHRILLDRGQEVEIMTQFSFDSTSVLSWLQRIREENITSTVRIGLPGPASVKTLLRFASRCGVSATASVMAKYGVSITQLLSTVTPMRLLNGLVENLRPGVHGDVRFHFYPFGGLKETVSWVDQHRRVSRQGSFEHQSA
jgi:methylenetetrahydrofolate reductase (NADPH)